MESDNMVFINIATNEIYKGKIPNKVTLPIHKNNPVPHSISVTYDETSTDWEENLERYMYLNGYTKKAGM